MKRRRRMSPLLPVHLFFTSVLFLAYPSSCLPISFTEETPDPRLGHHTTQKKIRSTVPASTKNSTSTTVRTTTASATSEENSDIATISTTDTSEMATSSLQLLEQPPGVGSDDANHHHAFPRNLLDFNVTLIGTNLQFQNGNSNDAETLDTTREILEGFLLGGYLNLTAPVLNLTLQLDDRSQLFRGSLIHTFSYSGNLFVWQLESNWNTYKVQQSQEDILKGKEGDVEQLLKSQGIALLVDNISVTPTDYTNPSLPHQDEEDPIPSIDSFPPPYKSNRDTSITKTYAIITGTVAFFAFLAFAFYVKRKSTQIKIQRELEMESRKKRISSSSGGGGGGGVDVVDEESVNVDEDTGSDHTMPSK